MRWKFIHDIFTVCSYMEYIRMSNAKVDRVVSTVRPTWPVFTDIWRANDPTGGDLEAVSISYSGQKPDVFWYLFVPLDLFEAERNFDLNFIPMNLEMNKS